MRESVGVKQLTVAHKRTQVHTHTRTRLLTLQYRALAYKREKGRNVFFFLNISYFKPLALKVALDSAQTHCDSSLQLALV